jgi:trehalose 6-phosphate phosphatase
MSFDFDGVLSPMNADPDAARPVPESLAAIDALASVVRRVAIISARPVDFLRTRLDALSGVDLYGLYGLEHSHDGGPTVTEPAALPYVPVMESLAARARVELPGSLVEYKRLSVALHYRTAPELAATVEEWAAERAGELGLRVQTGRMVVELKPPVDRDKGAVIGEAVASAGCAWYFGDDVSDLKAFAALRSREARDPAFFGVCVAVANPETGQAVADEADLTFDSPAALSRFLTAAAASLT